MKSFFLNIVEKFFNLFFSKQAKIIKQETIFERQKAVLDYKKAREKNKKYLSKFSGKIKYRKCPNIN